MIISEKLEPRRFLAWGTYPQLIDQDLSTREFPGVDGADELVVVIDSGINSAHPALAPHLWKNPDELPADGIDNDANGYIDDQIGWDFVRNDATPDDEAGHGTAVAGVLAASPFTFNSAQYAGIAPGAKIISLKVLDETGQYAPGAELHIENALQYVETLHARRPVTAVNLSLRTPPDLFAATYADEIDRLAAAGVIISASGGQSDPNADAHAPSSHPAAWATSVVDETDTLSPNVNRGPSLDMLAPGNRLPIPVRKGSGFALSGEGSSFATPFITGAAVLIRQIWPQATTDQVLAVLKESGASIRDASTSYTYSGLTYPRLNLHGALSLAVQRGPGTPLPTRSPFHGVPFGIGDRIEAEDFDRGAPAVSHSDSTPANLSGAWRDTAVDIESTGDSGSGFNVGYTLKGEWLEYTLSIPQTGFYTLNVRAASPVDGAKFHIESAGVNLTGSIAVPKTNSWQTYTTITRANVQLSAGLQVIRLVFDANNAWGFAGNYNYLSLVAQPTSPPPVVPPPATSGLTLSSVDIGAGKPAGATSVLAAGRDYDLTAGGNDIWNSSDQFRFAHVTLSGDFDLSVRVAGLLNTHSWAKAGLMARSSLSANSANVFALVTGGNGSRLSHRASAGGTSLLSPTVGPNTIPNMFLRLVRTGNLFNAYSAPDGTNWTSLGALTLNLPHTLYVGLAATSHNTSQATVAQFRELSRR